MLIGSLSCKGANLIAHHWSSGCLATLSAIEKQWRLCSFCLGALGERFSKSGLVQKIPRKFRGVRELCSRPKTVTVLCIRKFSNFVRRAVCFKIIYEPFFISCSNTCSIVLPTMTSKPVFPMKRS